MGRPKPPNIKANQQKTFDTELELHRPAGSTLTAANAIATDGQEGYISGVSSAATYDTGGGYQEGYFVVNVTALPEYVAGCWFDITLQGALDSSFASTAALARVVVGDAALPNRFISEDKGETVYVVPYSNMYGDEIYRHLRAYVNCGGTPSTGVTFSAFLSA